MYFILLAEKKSWRMLERNILGANVFFRVFDCGLFRLGSRFGGGWHGGSCSASLRPELRALGDNFCSIFFLPAVLVFPASSLDPPFNQDRASLLHVLGDCLRRPAEGDDVMVIGRFLPGSVFVFPNPVGCDRKRANFHSGGQRAEFRIASQVPYNDCFV